MNSAFLEQLFSRWANRLSFSRLFVFHDRLHHRKYWPTDFQSQYSENSNNFHGPLNWNNTLNLPGNWILFDFLFISRSNAGKIREIENAGAKGISIRICSTQHKILSPSLSICMLKIPILSFTHLYSRYI